MADEPIITPVQLQRTQMDVDRELSEAVRDRIAALRVSVKTRIVY